MSSIPKQQLDPEYDKELYDSALKSWCPGADVKVASLLGGGYSGATVLLVDIERGRSMATTAGDDPLQSGLYVLKLDSHRPHEGHDADEAQRHKEACSWSPGFARRHVPPLKRRFRIGERVALLYEVAGKRFNRLVRSDLLSVGPLQSRLRMLSENLLTQFNPESDVSHDDTVGGVLREWLGHRLESQRASAVLELAQSITGGRRAFVQSLHILPNPVELAGQVVGSKALNSAVVSIANSVRWQTMTLASIVLKAC